MTNITEFNQDTLAVHTPLTRDQALCVLPLVNKTDAETLNKILGGAVCFEPADTYFDRLKQALMLGEI